MESLPLITHKLDKLSYHLHIKNANNTLFNTFFKNIFFIIKWNLCEFYHFRIESHVI